MYRSILSPRAHSIDSESFEDAPNLMFNFFLAGERHSQYDLDLWERFIPYTPAQIYGLFTAGYGRDDVNVTVRAFETRRVEFEIDHEEGEIFRSKLTLRVGDDPSILNSKVVVDPDSQGKGHGRNSMRNWIETAAAFGFPEFSFDAAMSDGGFVWARMGAHLDRNEERQPFYADEERRLAVTLNARLEAARPFIGQANYRKAHALCQIQQPDDLVRLAEMGDIVVPKEAVAEAEEILPLFYSDVLDGMNRDCMNTIKTELKYLSSIFFNSGRGTCDYVSLPAFLKKQTVWSAVVDLSNAEQMKRVGDYVGGWRTIEPVMARHL